jgi:hypothetical protein
MELDQAVIGKHEVEIPSVSLPCIASTCITLTDLETAHWWGRERNSLLK